MMPSLLHVAMAVMMYSGQVHFSNMVIKKLHYKGEFSSRKIFCMCLYLHLNRYEEDGV